MSAEVIHGDCLAVLREMPAASYDAVVTDPPFFAPATHYQSRVQWQRKWADMSILEHWWTSLCSEFARVLKPTGALATFCNTDSYAAFYPGVFGSFPKTRALVWDKERPGLGRVWRHQHEFVIVGKMADAWEPTDGKLRRDVLRHKATLPRDRVHPVEKPAALLAEIIEAICPPGGIVLDPFTGGGSTGVGAIACGRRFVGIEREASYAETARREIAEAQSQQTLALEGVA